MAHEVWITGIGLTSSLGEGPEAHWRAMAEAPVPQPVIDLESAAPFAFYPMVPLDLDKQIPRRADQRQMEPWQRLGTYTAGLALEDAGLVGDAERLGQTHMVVAAGAGERDMNVDGDILKGIGAAPDAEEFLNERLSNDLRPTLFLAQLPNLLAGNISIVHKVTGSSRTFLGEEISGVSAVEIAWRRIRAGQGDIFLVGGASLAGRKDMILQRAIGGTLWQGAPISVWARPEKGGGTILGSLGAFLVIESREHAEARGRRPYARIGTVLTDQSRRRPGEAQAKASRQFDEVAAAAGDKPVAVLSGATGMAEATREEHDLLAALIGTGRVSTVRGTANMIGSGIEATFPGLVGLGALALSRKGFFKPSDETGFEQPETGVPQRIVATTWGIWRGEGMGLIEAVD
jgi:3-oxoacyl-[acyl-carrier-protein] synthase II